VTNDNAEPVTSDDADPVTSDDAEPLAGDNSEPRPKPSPRPRPRPSADAEATDGGADPDTRVGTAGDWDDLAADDASGPSRARIVALSVAVLLAAMLAGTFFWLDHQKTAADRAGRDGMAASVRAAETILSYDHRKIDADVAAASKLTTGQFRKDYTDTSKTVTPIAKEYKAVVKATVKASSVVSAAPERVVVLLFVDQSTQSTRVQGTQVDQARVRITMQKVGDEWLAAKVEAL
jgi:Mce-associated membrane protein